MIDWLLIGRDGIDFDNIDLYIQTNGTKIDYIGIDKYMNGITINKDRKSACRERVYVLV